MATPDGRTPRSGGSHFGDAPSRDGSPNQTGARAPRPAAKVGAPRSAVTGGRVSNRTAAATRRAGSHSVQRADRTRRRSRAPLFVLGLVAVAALLAIAFIVVPAIMGSGDDTQTIEPGTSVTVTVADGSGASAVADALFDAGVIADKSEFLSQVRRTNSESSIKSGTYSFTTGAELSTIIQMLTTGPNAETTLTIPEGYTLSAIASTVEQVLGIPADEFVSQAKASNYAQDYDFLEGVTTDTLEGFLFPKTYSFSGEGVTADQVIRAMLDQFEAEFSTLDTSFPESRGLTVAQLVNLASIVEKESTEETRGQVAAVFYNRLGNMGEPNYGFLQSDATTAYSVGHDPTPDEVHDESDPYSTYTHQGLPPTPICSPSLASLQAACAPDQATMDEGYFYFYFWTNDAGETEYAFSRTYEEHQQSFSGN